MKTIVVYKSSTGFTRTYAEWIAEKLGCEAIELKKCSQSDIEESDQVIFGGWIMGGMIMGLDKILKKNPSKLVVFAVGSSPVELIDMAAMKEQNHLSNQKLFYFPGGFRFEKLNFAVKIMLKSLRKSAAKKTDKTPQDEYMAKVLGTSFDVSDKKYIDSLLEECEG
jgi:menaquinone-dependent protoporphyrinogen IX oxidase